MTTSKGDKFQIVCAWCGRGTADPAPRAADARPVATPTPALPISHTICDSCFVKERAEIERVVKLRRKRTSA